MNISLILPNTAPLPFWLEKYKILSSKPYPPSPPLGLLSIAAYIENHGYNVNVIDNNAEKLDQEKLIKKILKTDPKVVAFHTTNITYPEVRNCFEQIKKENKDIVKIVGGPLASMYPEILAGNPNIDFVIRNEGELTLHEMLTKIEKNEKIKDIQGISYKKGKKIIHNEQRPFIENLDELPFPARHLVDMSKYPRRELFFDAYPVDAIGTSRGCPFNCQFCSSDRYMFYRTYRFRSAENVVDEIELLFEKYKTKGLYFREDLFTVNKKKLFETCDELKKRKIDAPWLCESRVDTVSKEKLKKMKSAGCEAIWFGCESGSQKVLDSINKEITVTQIKNAFKWCKEIGILTGAAFVIGFPSDTVEDINKTRDLARKIRSNYSWARIYIGTPRSPIYEEIIKKKYYRKECNWEGIVAVETPHLSLEKKAELHDQMEKEFTRITFKRMFSDAIFHKTPLYKTSKKFINYAKYALGG